MQKNSLAHLGKELLEAARIGNDDEVSDLMTQGAPFVTDWLGYSPLHFACINGHMSTVEILTRAGVSWEGRTKADKTPIHFAAQNGHRDIVQYLHKLGADINAKDMLNMTPLHWAVDEQHFLVVKFLVENKADINVKSKFDKTPLDIAQSNSDYHFIQFLKNAGQKCLNFDTEESPSTSDSTSVFDSLTTSIDSSFSRDYLGSSVASGAPVLLEGANQITLTEAGKLALQNWSSLYEQAEQNNQQDEKSDTIVQDIDEFIEKNPQKFLTITFGNQLFSQVSTPTTNQPLSYVCTSPAKVKTSGAKRKASADYSPARQFLKTSTKSGSAALQRQLTAARSKAEEFQEKLGEKEREIETYKRQLELLQSSEV
uniref:GA-binding protein subunit beta-1-like isoform X2 n=1 Tax=Ciona intestinalis TaxID=7719 RepID=UPI0005217221|nr:GA-binding protein subunit beta-1-like isoform X2 [Ciona intestinalis]|eukprot:XP_009858860.1 GA-binding protein subunit beta-1-like isoform X2 [Ciona intestinalis]